MRKALSLIQWLVSWGHRFILETRLQRTLVDDPTAEITIPVNLSHKQLEKMTNCANTYSCGDLHHTPGVIAALSNYEIQLVVPQSVLQNVLNCRTQVF